MLSLAANWVAAFAKGRIDDLRVRVGFQRTYSGGSITGLADDGAGNVRVSSVGHGLQVNDWVWLDAPYGKEHLSGYLEAFYRGWWEVQQVSSADLFDIDADWDGTGVGVKTGKWWYADNTVTGFLSGPCDAFDEHSSVASVSQISRSLDPLEMIMRTEDITFEFHKTKEMKNFFANNVVYQNEVFVWAGTKTLAVNDWEKVFSGIVDEYYPKGDKVKLKIKTKESMIEKATYEGGIVNMDPLIAIVYILSGQHHVRDINGYHGLNASSFDITNYSDISHYVVQRASVKDVYEDRSIKNPIPSKPLIEDLCRHAGGFISANRDNELQFYKFDTSTTRDNWTTGDFTDFRVVSVYKHFFNKIGVKSHGHYTAASIGEDRFEKHLELTDWDSANRYARVEEDMVNVYYGFTPTTKDKLIEADWVTGQGTISAMTVGNPAGESAPAAADGDSLAIENCNGIDFCGTKGFARFFKKQAPSGGFLVDSGYFGDGTIAAANQISTSRLGYLLVEGEIISLDAMQDIATGTRLDDIYTELADPQRAPYWPSIRSSSRIQFRVKDRGALGTIEASHFAGAWAYDVTIPVAMAQRYLERTANGMWVFECRTNLSKMHLEVNDIITMTTSEFYAYGHSSLTTAVKLQIIGKKVDLFGSKPGITWTVAYADETSPPSTDHVWGSRVRVPGSLQQMNMDTLDADDNNQVVLVSIYSGFDFTDDGGLIGTIDTGVVAWMNGKKPTRESFQYTYTASKDTFVGYDASREAFFFREENLGTSLPTKTGWQVWLWRIETDGADITDKEDLRWFRALAPDTVSAASVRTQSIGTFHQSADTEQRNYNWDMNQFTRDRATTEDDPPV